jgi:hypothetical protein
MILFYSSFFFLALFMIFAGVSLFDTRTVLGIDPWIKPMKFAISIAIYLFTIAWLMRDIRPAPRTRRVLEFTILATMIVEIVLIASQSYRGIPSHFNRTTPLNAAIFITMGVAISINTVAAAVLFFLSLRSRPDLTPSYLWGIRFGLLIFILASIEGGFMAGRLAHSVGAPDGGPGLPFVNWSTEAGDLRIAHFLGLHALQVLPLAGYFLGRTPVFVVAGFYFALFAGSLIQALAGYPLLRF